MRDEIKAERLAEIRYVAGLDVFEASYLANEAVKDGIPQDEVDEALAEGLGYERISDNA